MANVETVESLQILNYCNEPIRMIEINGEPWWVLKDVCDVLGLTNSRMIAERLDDDEKGVSLIYTPGGKQEMTIINEPGLYNVILRSDKPEAKKFKRWITHEVLPALRKTGTYTIPSSVEDDEPQAAYTGAQRLGDVVELAKLTAKLMKDNKRIPADILGTVGTQLEGFGVTMPDAFYSGAYSTLGYDNGDFSDAFVHFKNTILSNLHNFHNYKWGKLDGDKACILKPQFDAICKINGIDPKPFLRWLFNNKHIERDAKGQFTRVVSVNGKTVRCVVVKVEA